MPQSSLSPGGLLWFCYSWCALEIGVAWVCTQWNGALWQACGDRSWPTFSVLLLVWLGVGPWFSLAQSTGAYLRQRQAWRWRWALIQSLLPHLPQAQRQGIDHPEQRLTDDSLLLTGQGVELFYLILKDTLQACLFAVLILQYPMVLMYGRHPEDVWEHWSIRPLLLGCTCGYALLGNAIALRWVLGIQTYQQMIQRLEGKLRRRLLAWTCPQKLEGGPLIPSPVGMDGGHGCRGQQPFPPLPTRLPGLQERMYQQTWQLTTLTQLFQHTGLLLALLSALPTYFAGRIELGTAMTWMGSFRLLQAALASLLYHWPLLADTLAALERLGDLANLKACAHVDQV